MKTLGVVTLILVIIAGSLHWSLVGLSILNLIAVSAPGTSCCYPPPSMRIEQRKVPMLAINARPAARRAI
jgi:hypothetical protein